MAGGEEGLAILEEVGDGAAHRRRREQEAPVLLLKPASTGQFYKGHHCSSRRHPGMIFNRDSVENFSRQLYGSSHTEIIRGIKYEIGDLIN